MDLVGPGDAAEVTSRGEVWVYLRDPGVRPEPPRGGGDEESLAAVLTVAAELPEVGAQDMEIDSMLDPFTKPMGGGCTVKLSRDRGEEGRA